MHGRRQATDAEARALASAVRLRILRLCLDEALTNQEIAARLGRAPASVLHHVRTLVVTGFLEPQDERPGPRGSRERPYLATGKSWQLDSPSPLPVMLGAFGEEVALAPAEEVSLTRIGLRLDDAAREELQERLVALAEEFRARSVEGARPWSLLLVLHPDVQREEPR